LRSFHTNTKAAYGIVKEPPCRKTGIGTFASRRPARDPGTRPNPTPPKAAKIVIDRHPQNFSAFCDIDDKKP